MCKNLSLAGLLIATLSTTVLAGERDDWGDLSGRFIFEGDPPKQVTVSITKDRERLGVAVPDESLIVNQKNRGVENVVVFLEPGKKQKLRVHPSYAKNAQGKVRLRMKQGRFIPHVVLLRTSQTLVQENQDDVAYSVIVQLFSSSPRGPLLPAVDLIETTYAKEERFPAPIRCAIHPWMRGYMLLRSNPYMAKSDANGEFAIKRLPVGKHILRFWHERVGYVRDIAMGPLRSDARGRLTVQIRPEGVELKEIKLPSKLFVMQKKRPRVNGSPSP